jgi:hypothetical protein
MSGSDLATKLSALSLPLTSPKVPQKTPKTSPFALSLDLCCVLW